MRLIGKSLHNSINRNRKKLPSKNGANPKNKREGIYSVEKKPLVFNSLPHHELEKRKEKIRKEAKTIRKTKVSVYIVVFVLLLALAVIIWWMN